jgi:hypothetical protein
MLNKEKSDMPQDWPLWFCEGWTNGECAHVKPVRSPAINSRDRFSGHLTARRWIKVFFNGHGSLFISNYDGRTDL